MAKFRITDTRSVGEAGHADFVVEWLEGSLSAGDTFRVFDTHHPIVVTVVSATPRPGGAVLRCAVSWLGWDGNFAPSVVDTESPDRLSSFRYEVAPVTGPSHFRGKAAEYARYRVDYPAHVIAAALASAGIVPEDVVADLGSGTGMLSRWFLERGCRVFGVEPDDGMRHVAEENLSRFGARFTSVEGAAERTSLDDSSVTVVAAGNAFHYFDPRATRAEAERILQRGGRVLIVGHDGASTPNEYMQAYLAFIADVATPEARFFHERERSLRGMEAFFAGGRSHEEDMGDHTFPLTWDGLRGRFLSTSVAPAAGDPRLSAVLTQLLAVFQSFEKDGTVPHQLRWRYTWGQL